MTAATSNKFTKHHYLTVHDGYDYVEIAHRNLKGGAREYWPTPSSAARLRKLVSMRQLWTEQNRIQLHWGMPFDYITLASY